MRLILILFLISFSSKSYASIKDNLIKEMVKSRTSLLHLNKISMTKTRLVNVQFHLIKKYFVNTI